MRAGAALGNIALAALVACTAAESQGGSTDQGGLTLESKLPATFAAVSNVVELDGKRVAFVDTRDKLFLAADLGSGDIDTLGKRVDSIGPNSPAAEYKFPGWVAHLAGDTVALVDFSAQRTTLWNERGEALKVLPIAQAAGTTPVLVYDTVGYGYKIDYSPVLGGAAPGERVGGDSVVVLRIALASGKIDTVARLAAPEFGDARFGEQVQQAAVVFAPNDFFGVLPNGTAWVARGRENRVDWRTPQGKWSRGQKRPYTAVPVTQADKDRVLAQVREQGKQFGMPQNLKVEYPFAATKPPFDFALARPNGEVWLQRPRAGDAASAVYDVHAADGSWRREVAFPQGSSLAGFGTDGAIYGTIRDGERRTVGRFVMK
jgi:hypothetical protein